MITQGRPMQTAALFFPVHTSMQGQGVSAASTMAHAEAALEGGMGQYTSHVHASAGRERERLSQLQAYQQQITHVMQQLEQLPKKLQHSICVPYGRHAFFPGALQHTNEVRVHLGAGYYLHCTAHEARGILERRLDRLQVKLQSSQGLLDEQTGRLQAFQSAVVPGTGPDGERVMEIRESYDESEALLASAKLPPPHPITATTATTTTTTTSQQPTPSPSGRPFPSPSTSTSTAQPLITVIHESSHTGSSGAPPATAASAALPTVASSHTTKAGGTPAASSHAAAAAAAAAASSHAPAAAQAGARGDAELDRLFAHMDHLARLEELGEAAGSDSESETATHSHPTPQEGGEWAIGVGAAGIPGTVPQPGAQVQGGLEGVTDSDDDDESQGEEDEGEEEEEDEEEEDWSAAFTPVSIPQDRHTTTTTTTTAPPPLAKHQGPASPAANPPTQTASNTTTTTAAAPATALRKGFFLSKPSPAKPAPATRGTAAAPIKQPTQQPPTQQPPPPPQQQQQQQQEGPGKEQRELAAKRHAAFTGEVVERPPATASATTNTAPAPVAPTPPGGARSRQDHATSWPAGGQPASLPAGGQGGRAGGSSGAGPGAGVGGPAAEQPVQAPPKVSKFKQMRQAQA